MGANSKIEWTHHTFNPWIGCSKVSAGCANCYAEKFAGRFPRYRECWGVEARRVRTSDAYWRQPLAWDGDAAAAGVRRRVFCGSLCDVFEDREDLVSWRLDLQALINSTPNLDWLLLTKRPENISALWPCNEATAESLRTHVWVGTSVENQATADERIPALLKIPAAKRFISVEPMLGPVDFSAFFGGEYVGLPGDKIIPNYNFGIDWVICGGESGPNARPMHPDWVRDLRDQCVEAGLPFFFKQWGEWIHGNREAEENCMISPNGADVTELPGLWDEHTITISRVGKKRAGRVLDGRTWDQVPE